MLLHGVCYDFFFVTGFIYAEQKASAKARGQVQSLLVFFTQGLGMFLGFRFAGIEYEGAKHAFPGLKFFQGIEFPSSMLGNGVQPNDAALTQAITNARESADVSFLESFGKMFSQSIPEAVSAELVAETMGQWKEFWMLPAFMAAAITVVFFLAFWDRVDREAAISDAGDEPVATPDGAPA